MSVRNIGKIYKTIKNKEKSLKYFLVQNWSSKGKINWAKIMFTIKTMLFVGIIL